MEGKAKSGSGTALAYFAAKRPAIELAIESLARDRGSGLSSAPGGGAESMGRIAEFCLRGKMIRGCLTILGAEAGAAAAAAAGVDSGSGASVSAARDLFPRIAAAMELFQAGLLAHDDIMDRDEMRRGAPTIHARFAAEALARGAGAASRGAGAAEARFAAEARHVGEALGICLGDLCYFEAFGELARVLAGDSRSAKILALCAEALSEVAVAQMADVGWGSSKREVSEAEILAMYRYKTARYSFSLPLAVGALAAGAEGLVGPFTRLGEELGMLFQIKDDELGLFGDGEATGKGLGSDLREGKKTLFRARLLAAAPSGEAKRLAALFGGAEAGAVEGVVAGAEDVAYLRRLSEELGVGASIRALSAAAEARAREMLAGLDLGPECAAVLDSLVEYVTRRDR